MISSDGKVLTLKLTLTLTHTHTFTHTHTLSLSLSLKHNICLFPPSLNIDRRALKQERQREGKACVRVLFLSVSLRASCECAVCSE